MWALPLGMQSTANSVIGITLISILAAIPLMYLRPTGPEVEIFVTLRPIEPWAFL